MLNGILGPRGLVVVHRGEEGERLLSVDCDNDDDVEQQHMRCVGACCPFQFHLCEGVWAGSSVAFKGHTGTRRFKQDTPPTITNPRDFRRLDSLTATEVLRMLDALTN